MKSRILALVLALVLCVSLFTPAMALEYGEEYQGYYKDTQQQYRDVPTNYWAFQSIATCSQRDWFGGYPDGSFRPDNKISRNEAAKVFAVALGLTLEEDPTPSFTDTAYDWAKAYIEAAKVLFPNPANLQGTTSFRPTQTITREETFYALVVAWKYASKVKNADLSVLNMFKDANSISAGVKPYVAIGVAEGLFAGYPDGTIRAQDGLTRAEFATLLARALAHGYGPDDTSAPKIELDRYSEKTYDEKVVISGKVSPMASGTTLELDGSKVQLNSNGSFTVTLWPEVGANQYTLVATNTYGVKSTSEIRFERQASKVNIEILSNVPTETELEKLDVNGVIKNYTPDCTLLLDGSLNGVSINSSGYFNFTLTLQEGRNSFTLEVRRNNEVVGSTTITATRKAEEPYLLFNETVPTTTEADYLTVDCQVVNYKPEYKVTLNGETLSGSSNGLFNLPLRLNDGANEFTLNVTGRGANNRETILVTEKFRVTRTFKPVEIMLPDMPATYDCDQGQLTGMVSNFTDDCTLYLNGNPISVGSDGTFTVTLTFKDGVNKFTFEAKRKGSVVDTKSFNVTKAAAGAGEWVESLPAGVDSSLYNIETKTQYRYRDKTKETTTEQTSSSSAPSKSGWTYSNTTSAWGPEKDNGYTVVSGSDTRNVRTVSELTKNGYTQYQYYGYKTSKTNDGKRAWHYCLSAGKSIYGGSWSYITTDWLNSPLSYDKSSGSHSAHSGCEGPSGTAYRYLWNGDYYYWQRTRTVDPEYKVHYYYSDKVFTHSYYRWVAGNWSAYGDTPYTASESRDVETRTVYRYNLK